MQPLPFVAVSYTKFSITAQRSTLKALLQMEVAPSVSATKFVRFTQKSEYFAVRSPCPLRAKSEPTFHCAEGGMIVGADQFLGSISTNKMRSGSFVLFSAVCARFPVSKKYSPAL